MSPAAYVQDDPVHECQGEGVREGQDGSDVHSGAKHQGNVVLACPDVSGMSRQRPQIRPLVDVHTIYDTNHVGADAHYIQLITKLEEKLHEQKYKYTNCGRDCLLGKSTIQQQVDHITQADFIFCLISFDQQTGQVSTGLIDHIKRALTKKQQTGHTNRIIPVFCSMSEEQVREIRDTHLLQMMLVNHIIARHGDLTYIEKVVAALAATPSGKNSS